MPKSALPVDVEERLVGAGAEQTDPALVIERRRRHLSGAESVALPMRREPLLVSAPAMLRIVPPAPPLWSTRSSPLLSRKVATVFVPADWKRRLNKSVIELTVPIEAEATASPVAIVTSELAPGTPAGLQLSASSQSGDGARPCRFAHDASPYPDCHAMPALQRPPRCSANLTSVPVPLSGARVKPDFEYSPVIRILAVKLPSCSLSVPPVPREFSTKLYVVPV